MLKSLRVLVLFILLLFGCLAMFGQEVGLVDLVILDQNGDRVATASIDLVDKKTKEITKIQYNDFSAITLNAGSYLIKILSPGFKVYEKDVVILAGRNRFEIRLELEEVEAELDVRLSTRQKRIADAFSRSLTEKEISELPESGQDIRKELERRYGKDIVFKINGSLDGSQIPPRDQISSIKVIRNAFDAEFHKLTSTIIDIRTKTVITRFGGFVYTLFNDSSLNARNAFDLERQPEQRKFAMASLFLPIVEKQSSLLISGFFADNFDTRNFVGVDPTEMIERQRKVKSRFALNSVTLNQLLVRDHLARITYTNDISRGTGLGVFDFPERGTLRNRQKHKLSVFESGLLGQRFVSDFRFQLSKELDRVSSLSSEPSLIVLDAFNKGGAGIDRKSDITSATFGNNLLFDYKSHSLKIGTEINYEKIKLTNQDGSNGSFLFSSIEDFENKSPARFLQTQGIGKVNLEQLKTAFYIQDYFQLNKSLSLSVGLRYEWQSDVEDLNNFSPRLGFVWSPEKSGNLIIKGGVGIFNDSLSISARSSILSGDGSQRRSILVLNPQFPDISIGDSKENSLPSSVSRIDDGLVTPRIYIGQLAFSFKLGSKSRFEGIYSLKRGLNHFRSRDINAPVSGERPNADFFRISLLESSGNSTENSFNLKYNQSLVGRNFFVDYIFAKRLDNFSDIFALPSNNLDIDSDFGPSNNDRMHKLEVSTEIRLAKILILTPSFHLKSGLPYNITTGFDDNRDSVFNDRPFGVKRNSVRGEFIKEFNLSLRWMLPVETKRIQGLTLNANIRNLLNTKNFIGYTGVQTSPFFRQPNRADSSRTLDIALSFSF